MKKNITRNDFILTRSKISGLQLEQQNTFNKLERIAKTYGLEVDRDIVSNISNEIIKSQHNPIGLKPLEIINQPHNKLKMKEIDNLISEMGGLDRFIEPAVNQKWKEKYIYEYTSDVDIAELMIIVRGLALDMQKIGINDSEIYNVLFSEFGYNNLTDEFFIDTLKMAVMIRNGEN